MIDDNNTFNLASAFLLFVLLASAVATDLRNHRIPNLLLVSALNVALMLQVLGGGVDGLMTGIGGLVLGIAMLLPLYAVGGMAAGDVKLIGVVGCFIGPWGAVVAGLATMMVGAVFGITIIIWRRLGSSPGLHLAQDSVFSKNKPQPTSIRHDWGRSGDVTEMPYAPAIAVGTVVALLYIDYLPTHFLGLSE